MKLISWNLNGLEDNHLDKRTEAAMFQILLGAPIEALVTHGFKPKSPDIVLLQEVVERTYHAHIVPHFKAAGFSIFPPKPTERSYFEVVAVRGNGIEASYIPFAYSPQGRGLTILKLADLTVMTAHLESLKEGRFMRLEQADFIFKEMQKHGACIFAGDTNLRKEEWQRLENNRIQDAWISTGSAEKHRITWQSGSSKSRFDRVWSKQIKVKKFETFGRKKIAGIDERASDHLALRVEFEL